MKSQYFIDRFKIQVEGLMSSPSTPSHWKTQAGQLLATLTTAFGTKVDITEEDLKAMTEKFYTSLDGLAAANSAWKVTGFNPAKRPLHHLAKEFAEWARIVFNNIINYAKTPILPDGSPKRYKEILEQTKQAAIYGYKLGEEIVALDPKTIQEMQIGSKRFDSEEIAKIQASLRPKYPSTEVRVVGDDCLRVAHSLKSQGLNPLLLNMASPDVAGGGAEGGGIAQEESIYYRSGYFRALDRKYNPGTPFYPLPEFSGIYTPCVTIVRDERYRFIPPWNVDMLAVAGYVHPSVPDKIFLGGTEKKIETMLTIAADRGCDSLLLGALGCGGFKKDETTKEIVSDLFKKVITNPKFSGLFKNITFAILQDGSGNYETFSRKLNFTMTTIATPHATPGVSLMASPPPPVETKTEVETIRVQKANVYADKVFALYKDIDRNIPFYRHYHGTSEGRKQLEDCFDKAILYSEQCALTDKKKSSSFLEYCDATEERRLTLQAEIDFILRGRERPKV